MLESLLLHYGCSNKHLNKDNLELQSFTSFFTSLIIFCECDISTDTNWMKIASQFLRKFLILRSWCCDQKNYRHELCVIFGVIAGIIERRTFVNAPGGPNAGPHPRRNHTSSWARVLPGHEASWNGPCCVSRAHRCGYVFSHAYTA